MNYEEQLEKYEQLLREQQLNNNMQQMGQQQQDLIMQDQEKGMIKEQLDLGDDIERIHHLLKGHVLKRDENGITRWTKPDNNDMVILSEYGINYVMGAIQWYLNKNTLLSNYDDQQIAAKMEDFATTLADDIFMEYDKMFFYPTLEDCKEEIKRRIQSKKEIKMFAMELLGKEADEKQIEAEIKKVMEDRIERELEIIRQQKIKNKLKRFESILRFIQDTVHSAYQRAWKGQERTTLRQHIHISETKGGLPMQQQPQGFNPLSVFKRK